MRILGIDYGSKRVGLSLSDESGSMAFPLKTIVNSESLMEEIEEICKEKEVKLVVIGESKDFKGKPI